jgi:hypothetical protein
VRVDLQRFEQACQALARACIPDATVRLAAESGPVPRLCLGPVTMRAADGGWRALFEAPLAETIGADTVSRPENWPVVLARYLLEAQGWRLRAESRLGGAEITLEPAPAT